MKNSIYISGVISVVVLTVGAMFKIQHWPAAAILLMVSIVFFTLFFLPFALWNNYKKEKKDTYLYVTIFITLFICFSAALFKILHWPGAGILILIALIAPFIIFLPAYIYFYNKSANKDITKLIAILFLLVFVALMDAFLSIGVSKDIIDNTTLTNQATNQITSVLKERNEKLYENISSSQAISLDAQQVTDFKNRTKEICNLIDEMRFALVKSGGKDNEFCISDAGDINIWEVKGKDNASLAAKILLHTDKALMLKNQIAAYKEYVKDLKLQGFNLDIDEMLDVDNINYKGESEPWENVHFGNPIMVWGLQKLDMIRMKVKLVEAEVLSNFLLHRD